jgi:hypothetical protein
MSAEEDNIRFDVRRRGKHQIRSQKRKITADYISGEEDTMRFDVMRRGEHQITVVHEIAGRYEIADHLKI